MAAVNAEPLLARIARALAGARIEAVLIGNAAAALQGAPVTTLDFCYRRTRFSDARIRRLLALPMNRRTHFLRVRLPGGGSCL
jgi:hypothetical protein